jgi:hypothetical protein
MKIKILVMRTLQRWDRFFQNPILGGYQFKRLPKNQELTGRLLTTDLITGLIIKSKLNN